MKRLMMAAIVGMCIGVGACSHQGGGSITAPSEAFVGATATTNSRLGTKALNGAGVVFDTTQVGRVTITNGDSAAHRFAFYVWDASVIDSQVLMARLQKTIQPGQTDTLTVAFEQVCGRSYQRDVYVDIVNYEGATTEAETRNYFYAAPGMLWSNEVGNCEPGTVVTPPVVTTPPVVNEPPIVVPPPIDPPVVVDPPVEPPVVTPPACAAPSVGGGPFDIPTPNGVNARLAVAQSYVAGVVAVGNAGGSFGGNNAVGNFTPNQNYAVVIFHKGNDARVYTGLQAGVTYSLVWGKNGVSAFAFNCVQ